MTTSASGDSGGRHRISDESLLLMMAIEVDPIFKNVASELIEQRRTVAKLTEERDLLNHSLDSVREISVIKLPDPLGYIYRRSSGDWCHPDSSITDVFPTALEAIRAAIATTNGGGE